MAYTDKNYKTKKALKEDLAGGVEITVFQPGGIFDNKVPDGTAYLEGPHFPAPHSWYAQATIKDGKVVKIK